jgi:FtsH-binding integral membrane protein
LRLGPLFRWTVYVLYGALVVSGCSWLLADHYKDAPDGDLYQTLAANLLMVHGGTAMAALIALGALFPVHMTLGWRSRRNRIMGSIMVLVNAILIVTAFALYYLGSEAVRPWMSDIHIAVGIVLPALFVGHVVTGRQTRK